MKTWQLQEAKARFSEVVKSAQREGLQTITVRGEVKVYILSKQDYERLQPPKESLVSFMRHSPLFGVEMDISRDRSMTREDGSIA